MCTVAAKRHEYERRLFICNLRVDMIFLVVNHFSSPLLTLIILSSLNFYTANTTNVDYNCLGVSKIEVPRDVPQ